MRSSKKMSTGLVITGALAGMLLASATSFAAGRAPHGAVATPHATTADGGAAETPALRLSTPAFQAGGEIPQRFTCEGENVSPALHWTDPPAGTRSLVLIADDPDTPAGTWVHWVVYDLPATCRSLREAVPARDRIDGGGTQGRNDFDKIGYGGPCPPPGKPHRYFFRLYALDTKLDLKPGATKRAVEEAMQGHIIARTELVGRYHR